ncbi:aldehyde dehydrogenase family protein [Kutzneria kofuensis]|uniref:aldehyde dehydrogenase family protein n=1 Tax=Kutzneria kofuensis TaxID=103725 RepID=UPI0031E74D3F
MIVDTDADPAVTAERLVDTKFLNAGQTCVAPDYVLAVGDAAARLEPALAAAVRAKFGDEPSDSPLYGRIVNHRHFDRLNNLLASGRVVVGGPDRPDAKYIAPTVLADVSPDAPVMSEEIFGPILPIIAVPDVDAPSGSSPRGTSRWRSTPSPSPSRRRHGSWPKPPPARVGFGLPVLHLTVPSLPFGGVGESGMGRYHGKYSIDTFSHLKAVLDKPLA